MNELKDKDLREALSRREARRTKPEVPADFCNNIMQETAPKHLRPMIWRWMAAAAVVLVLIGVGTTMIEKEETAPVMTPQRHQESAPEMAQQINQEPASEMAQQINQKPAPVNPSKPQDKVVSQATATVQAPRQGTVSMQSQNLHYASMQDTTYQDPARVDEFIAKLAHYNEVEAVALDCDHSDSTIVSKAYVFEDSKELDLFARLLQVACWYDSKTPGYLLNFSHQQFFFTLKDLHRGQKYLWMAERIGGGRILLQSTRSTLNVVPSPACYQNFREKLTVPGNINHQNI